MGNDDLVKGAVDKGCEGGRGYWKEEIMVVSPQGVTPPHTGLGSPVEAVSVWVKRDLAGRVRGDLNR